MVYKRFSCCGIELDGRIGLKEIEGKKAYSDTYPLFIDGWTELGSTG